MFKTSSLCAWEIPISEATNRISGYTYDGAGNLTNDGSKTYTYDGENRLTAIIVGGTTIAQYWYAAGNRRVAKAFRGVTTAYFFGVGEYSNGVWQKLYVGVPGARVEYNGDGTRKHNQQRAKIYRVLPR